MNMFIVLQIKFENILDYVFFFIYFKSNFSIKLNQKQNLYGRIKYEKKDKYIILYISNLFNNNDLSVFT